MSLKLTASCAFTVASLLLGALPGQAFAQQSKCGPVSELSDMLDMVGDVFTDPDSAAAALRADLGVVTPPSGAVKEVVADSRTCNQLLGATRKALRQLYGGGKDSPFNESTFGFFRVGDYYVSLQLPPPQTGDIVVTGRVEFLIFRVTDLAFVGRLLA